ncbi:hypothetical protein IWX46DRAFT_334233 [Phyllosticta citricarpa]|uniref:Uncharacterized protein n=1 Tax=Phyllosticta citricarpa TaxID=55181 RepID=A0ABR1LDS1_9PEZI
MPAYLPTASVHRARQLASTRNHRVQSRALPSLAMARTSPSASAAIKRDRTSLGNLNFARPYRHEHTLPRELDRSTTSNRLDSTASADHESGMGHTYSTGLQTTSWLWAKRRASSAKTGSLCATASNDPTETLATLDRILPRRILSPSAQTVGAPVVTDTQKRRARPLKARTAFRQSRACTTTALQQGIFLLVAGYRVES